MQTGYRSWQLSCIQFPSVLCWRAAATTLFARTLHCCCIAAALLLLLLRQVSAAAFTKGLLALEGSSLTPILVSLVTKDASMLDAFGKVGCCTAYFVYTAIC
jgi:hypothetical protein